MIEPVHSLRILPLNAVDHLGPPSERLGRGVTVYWMTGIPEAHPSKRRKKEITERVIWKFQRVAFNMLRDDQKDTPPQSPEEARSYALRAYILIASREAIPSDAEIRYEVIE